MRHDYSQAKAHSDSGHVRGVATWAWAVIAAGLFAVSMFFMLQPGF
ncbi:MAG TPA: hypothetical protein VG713_01775 [Pirellulales bacterium]|jgi:hypothetical protein|nr:hypothetical protein [Pirellulales bacterium]